MSLNNLNNIGLGSVVTVEGWSGQYVVVDYNIRENMGSMSYNRYYYLIPLVQAEKMDYYVPNQTATREVHVTGITATPRIIIDEEVAPFRMTKEVKYKIDRMKPKTITIYE